MFVELLLSVRELAAADVLGAEMRGQRVDGEHPHRPVAVLVFAGDLLGLLRQQHLVVGVEAFRDVDLVQERVDEPVRVSSSSVLPSISWASIAAWSVSSERPRTMSSMRSGRKVSSESMNTARPWRPPYSVGSWTFTASWWVTWDFPRRTRRTLR